MNAIRNWAQMTARWSLWLTLLGVVAAANGQTCQSSEDLPVASRTALETTAKRFFEMAAHGDYAGLRQNSIASLASNFESVAAAVTDNQQTFSGAEGIVRTVFLLTAEGTEPLVRAEFLCGVFGKSGQTSSSAVFVLN